MEYYSKDCRLAAIAFCILTLIVGCSGDPDVSQRGAEDRESVQSDDVQPEVPYVDADRQHSTAHEGVTADEPRDVAQKATVADSTPPTGVKRQEIGFDDSRFEIQPKEEFSRLLMTDEIRKLVGKRVRIQGFMQGAFQADDLKDFVLIHNLRALFGGSEPPLYEPILVTLAPGSTTSFTTSKMTVEGKFLIREFPEDGSGPLAIYAIQDATVINSDGR
jgi:hypothetical protein